MLKSKTKALQQGIDEANRSLLLIMSDPEGRDAGALINFITYSQHLKDKLTHYAHLSLNHTNDKETSVVSIYKCKKKYRSNKHQSHVTAL